MDQEAALGAGSVYTCTDKKVQQKAVLKWSVQLITSGENGGGEETRDPYRLGKSQEEKGSSTLWEWKWRTIETQDQICSLAPVHTAKGQRYRAMPEPQAAFRHASSLAFRHGLLGYRCGH